MSDKFKGKYRATSFRLPGWDYRNKGRYFITICTKNRFHFFGDIKNGKMNLSEIGQYAHKFWASIPDHFPNIELGVFVIMPDHMHGILILGDDDDDDDDDAEALQCNASTIDDSTIDDSIVESSIVPQTPNQQMSNISPKAGSISTIIRSYKSVVSKHARRIDIGFSWQSKFHDYVIRNDKAYHNIHHYILNNPKKWDVDKNS